MAPPELASRLQSLPPILDKMHQTPISSCSKGSRGLSVLSRVIGIFTDTTISPSLSLRQCPNRYAIRAGRNLPDKEFRSTLLLEDQRTCCWRADHFCRPPHVAMGYGLYLHPRRSLEVWRIVSEDCNNLDGLPRFIVSTILAISSNPSMLKC